MGRICPKANVYKARCGKVCVCVHEDLQDIDADLLSIGEWRGQGGEGSLFILAIGHVDHPYWMLPGIQSCGISFQDVVAFRGFVLADAQCLPEVRGTFCIKLQNFQKLVSLDKK